MDEIQIGFTPDELLAVKVVLRNLLNSQAVIDTSFVAEPVYSRVQLAAVQAAHRKCRDLARANELVGACPRCGEDLDPRSAMSRRDFRTEICTACGTDEAYIDAGLRSVPGRPLVPTWRWQAG